MHQIKIIGSSELGWHRVDQLNADALMRFASVPDVHFFNVSIGGAVNAPSTMVGYAKCDACPFEMIDAFEVLRMIRQLFFKVETDGQVSRF